MGNPQHPQTQTTVQFHSSSTAVTHDNRLPSHVSIELIILELYVGVGLFFSSAAVDPFSVEVREKGSFSSDESQEPHPYNVFWILQGRADVVRGQSACWNIVVGAQFTGSSLCHLSNLLCRT